MTINYIMRFIYVEINLNENSYIISSCNYILILKSMNDHMKIAKYYIISDDINAENSIMTLKSNSISFFISNLKSCFMCRSFLRNINKYDRIIRRAWIDETIKKFII